MRERQFNYRLNSISLSCHVHSGCQVRVVLYYISVHLFLGLVWIDIDLKIDLPRDALYINLHLDLLLCLLNFN